MYLFSIQPQENNWKNFNVLKAIENHACSICDHIIRCSQAWEGEKEESVEAKTLK